MKNLQKTVNYILLRHPSTRDNDRLLCAYVWQLEEPTRFSTMHADTFLEMFVEGRFSSPDTITRLRRKAQEEHESLRGELWIERQERQRGVQKDLGYHREEGDGIPPNQIGLF